MGRSFWGVLLLGICLSGGNDNAAGIRLPVWMMLLCSLIMGTGTSIGGKKIIKSVGMDMVKLEKYQGFSADLAGALCLLLSSVFGIPVSTTHTKTTAVMGVGAVKRLSAVSGMTSISYSINEEKTNVIMGKEIVNLYGPGYITDSISDVTYQILPLSFYQVNPVQTEKLYGTALEYAGLTGKETVWDLYCGIGTISLFLAQKAKKVYGVEIVPQAIEDARRNARLNGMENVEFFVGKAEEVLPEQYEKNQIYADVIVVDPPRKGCDQMCLDTILKMRPERVVYVSCDSATLARDLRYLVEWGV